MTKRKGNRRNKVIGTTIESLPHELLTEILAQVASSSVADLSKAKLSCKTLLQAADDDYVFERASMKKFHIPPWWPINNNKYAKLFLNRCKKIGNPETLYRFGMYEYFSLGCTDSGFRLLRRAAEKKHAEATYVYSVIVLCSAGGGRQYRRRQGFELLSSLLLNGGHDYGIIRECRRKTRGIIHDLWIRNVIIDEDGEFNAKTCSCSCTKKKRGWDDDEFDVFIGCCESCLCNTEVTFFCNLLTNNFTLRL